METEKLSSGSYHCPLLTHVLRLRAPVPESPQPQSQSFQTEQQAGQPPGRLGVQPHVEESSLSSSKFWNFPPSITMFRHSPGLPV